jgi:hypothetical protein
MFTISACQNLLLQTSEKAKIFGNGWLIRSIPVSDYGKNFRGEKFFRNFVSVHCVQGSLALSSRCQQLLVSQDKILSVVAMTT